MSVTRHHAEWLSLVEVSGPFLSMPVLLRVFPQGLDDLDPDARALLLAAHEEWEEQRSDRAYHGEWIRFVLDRVLEWPAELLVEGQRQPPGLEANIPEHGERLRPDLALLDPDTRRPRALVAVWPHTQGLERQARGHRWSASPATRMQSLLLATGVQLGLVTNGEHWMLVRAAPNTPTTFVSFYASLWGEEPLTLRAWQSLLGVRRFFGVPDRDTLPALLVESEADQHEITDQLGLQVRRSVELLVSAIDRIDQERGGVLLRDLSEKVLYEAAVTLMMRLVFLLAAEERRLLPVDLPVYQQHYAVAPLREQLRAVADRHGEEILERRAAAWPRLLATFRAVHAGVAHPDLSLKAYGGGLFDPDRYPFLEGRPPGKSWRHVEARPLPIHDRDVLHLLESLQLLQVRVQGGGAAESRRISFRGLGVEQIGHVYEGLLDHTAVRAPEPVLGLRGTKSQEPEIPLSVLEARAQAGEQSLAAWLAERTGRGAPALRKLLGVAPPDEAGLRVACGGQDALLARVRPFAALLRQDPTGLPVVVHAGSVYVTQGSDRRSTGTHYTPTSLTEPIVQHTLEPVVYVGPAEGLPREAWRLRPAAELLGLKVCDMAMGSGAFLVQACRWLGDRLVESWAEAEARHPGQVVVTPEGALSKGDPAERLVPADPDERAALARRLVADRCLYGVDRNPLAVEMGRLSLWLVTLQKDRPFTFLNHALRPGDSLLGVTDPNQLDRLHLFPARAAQVTLFTQRVAEAVQTAREARARLEALSDERVEDTDRKEQLLAEADRAVALLRVLGNLVVGGALAHVGQRPAVLDGAMERARALVELVLKETAEIPRLARVKTLRDLAAEWLKAGASPSGEVPRPFHWWVEFPEVASQGGFDAVVGNPPFLGGSRISSELGDTYQDFLKLAWPALVGKIDLTLYFFHRAAALLRTEGLYGLITTSKVAEGANATIGLKPLTTSPWRIARSVRELSWPGAAAVRISMVHGTRRSWIPSPVLNDEQVAGIAPDLTASVDTTTSWQLVENDGKSYIGAKPDSLGFILTDTERTRIIDAAPGEQAIIRRYIIGNDINSRTDRTGSRWIIDYTGLTIVQAQKYALTFDHVQRNVYPGRMELKRESYRARWWQYTEPSLEAHAAARYLPRVPALSRVSNHFIVELIDTAHVIADKIALFIFDGWHHFGILQGALHESWAIARGGKRGVGATFEYSPVSCFRTFPFPRPTPAAQSHLAATAEAYWTHRDALVRERNICLRDLYDRFHDPQDHEQAIIHLRDLHVAMDEAAARAYDWDDLALDHDHRDSPLGLRFTISPAARRELLARLLALNHARHAEEVAAGLHDPKRKSTRRPSEDEDPPSEGAPEPEASDPRQLTLLSPKRASRKKERT